MKLRVTTFPRQKYDSDLSRLDEVAPADRERVEKYARALEILGTE